MNPNYMRNSKFFYRDGRRRPGVINESIPVKREEEDPAKADRRNREMVRRKIGELVKSGMTVKEAVRTFMKDPQNEKLIKSFKYFDNANVNLENIFINWCTENEKNKKDFERC